MSGWLSNEAYKIGLSSPSTTLSSPSTTFHRTAVSHRLLAVRKALADAEAVRVETVQRIAEAAEVRRPIEYLWTGPIFVD